MTPNEPGAAGQQSSSHLILTLRTAWSGTRTWHRIALV